MRQALKRANWDKLNTTFNSMQASDEAYLRLLRNVFQKTNRDVLKIVNNKVPRKIMTEIRKKIDYILDGTVNILSDKQRNVLLEHYFNGEGIQSIADRVEGSRSLVNQIKNDAVEIIRVVYSEDLIHAINPDKYSLSEHRLSLLFEELHKSSDGIQNKISIIQKLIIKYKFSNIIDLISVFSSKGSLIKEEGFGEKSVKLLNSALEKLNYFDNGCITSNHLDIQDSNSILHLFRGLHNSLTQIQNATAYIINTITGCITKNYFKKKDNKRIILLFSELRNASMKTQHIIKCIVDYMNTKQIVDIRDFIEKYPNRESMNAIKDEPGSQIGDEHLNMISRALSSLGYPY